MAALWGIRAAQKAQNGESQQNDLQHAGTGFLRHQGPLFPPNSPVGDVMVCRGVLMVESQGMS